MRVCDEAGEELLAATFAHDEKGLRVPRRALVRLRVELVAIERPDGLLVASCARSWSGSGRTGAPFPFDPQLFGGVGQANPDWNRGVMRP